MNLNRCHWIPAVALAVSAWLTGAARAQEGEVPMKPPVTRITTTVEPVCESVSPKTIHGWHSNRLLMYRGQLYATAVVPVAGRKDEGDSGVVGSGCDGAFFRREATGKWTQVGTGPRGDYATCVGNYITCVGRDGAFWIVGSKGYGDCTVYRTAKPLDWTSFAAVQTGTNAYLGAAISAEGNFLLLFAETGEMRIDRPNAVITAFYDRESDKWYRSRMETPEGRYGYEGVILRGRKALAVMQSALQDPKGNPTPPHYTWRHVRLAKCDDLTAGRWTNKPWLMPAFGDTALSDLTEAPDGNLYLSYWHRAASSLEELAKTPLRHYVARIHDDLALDNCATGLETKAGSGGSRLVLSRKGNWYLVGRPPAGGDLHLWRLDSAKDFTPTQEFVLAGTDKFQGYVTHILRPERFGGEADGDTVHLLNCEITPARARLWHASFRLPGDD